MQPRNSLRKRCYLLEVLETIHDNRDIAWQRGENGSSQGAVEGRESAHPCRTHQPVPRCASPRHEIENARRIVLPTLSSLIGVHPAPSTVPPPPARAGRPRRLHIVSRVAFGVLWGRLPQCQASPIRGAASVSSRESAWRWLVAAPPASTSASSASPVLPSARGRQRRPRPSTLLSAPNAPGVSSAPLLPLRRNADARQLCD